MDILIGCDPEVFLKDRETGLFQSAFGKFPGTKKNPFPVINGAIQVDGVALEFNINPARDEEQFVSNVTSVFDQLKQMVKEVTDDKWIVSLSPVARFAPSVWNEIPEEAKILGCDPDFNYDGFEQYGPTDLVKQPIRTGSGHIHIGWGDGFDPSDFSHRNECKEVSKFFYEKQSIHYVRLTTDERTRLRYYGNNGAFRPKPYGIELRSESNKWLKDKTTIRNKYREYHKMFHELIGE